MTSLLDDWLKLTRVGHLDATTDDSNHLLRNLSQAAKFQPCLNFQFLNDFQKIIFHISS